MLFRSDQIEISSIYSHGRMLQTINDGSGHINDPKDQLVALEFQVRHKDHHIKHLRYLTRCAKRHNKYGTAREIERQLIVEKHQLKVLKNRRNYLFNRLTGKRDFGPQRTGPWVCEKTAHLRALRLKRDALLAT